MGNSGNSNLHRAQIAKEDEFYTQIADIEHELRHYKKHFRGKIILCNCDDPYESNFFKYFAMNFNSLGLKKLIATCYKGSPVVGSQLSLFDDEITVDDAFKLEINEIKDFNGDGAINMYDVEWLIKNESNVMSKLNEGGDFRSSECLELIDEADIVVTNPPFSLFREYVSCLMEHNKKFLIIGNQNAITYKDFFPLLMNNEVWLGYKFGDMAFTVPDDYEPRETRFWIDENGQKWRSLGNICWFTNLDIAKRHEDMVMYKRYTPSEYPHYMNYDAIEVGRASDIPYDYPGLMGVPITFMDKYNPDQFEIIGYSSFLANAMEEIKIATNGRRTGGDAFFIKQDDGSVKRLYGRVVIRNKHPEVEE